MKNTHMNRYLINLLRKRSIIYLIRNYKCGSTFNYSNMYEYVYRNSIYAISRQYSVIIRAYKLSHKTYSRSILEGVNRSVMAQTLDLLYKIYNYGESINFDNI